MGRLTNKRLKSEWEHAGKVWVIPQENTSDHIQEFDGDVLQVENEKVVMKPKRALKGQNWHRSNNNGDGWFTMKNAKSGKFLTAKNDGTTIATGKSCLSC